MKLKKKAARSPQILELSAADLATVSGGGETAERPTEMISLNFALIATATSSR